MHRFYDPDISMQSSELPKDEALHAIKSLRLKLGDDIQILNGKGDLFHAEISGMEKRSVQIEVKEIEHMEVLSPTLHLAISPLKQNDRFEALVEKATELGVASISPIISHRSERKNINESRLHRIAVSAIKQSGNPYLPVINPISTFKEFVSNAKEEYRYFGHCEQGSKTPINRIQVNQDTLILIGPEGDFTSEEINLAIDKGFKAIDMGSLTLRAETAGMAFCAYFHMNRTS